MLHFGNLAHQAGESVIAVLGQGVELSGLVQGYDGDAALLRHPDGFLGHCEREMCLRSGREWPLFGLDVTNW